MRAMTFPSGLGPTGGVFPPSVGDAAAAVSHVVAAAVESGSALHHLISEGEDAAGRALLAMTAEGHEMVATVVARMAAFESRTLVNALRGGPSTASVDEANAAVLAALKDRSIKSILDVVAVMNRIDAALPRGDGLKWFNRLYHMVTEGVGAHLVGAWEGPAWLDGLDLVFAELYFSGIEKCLSTPGSGPLAWRALLDARSDHRISPVQFALAGMSAHINRDLAVAVARTWVAKNTAVRERDTAEYRDYVKVNKLLDAVEPKALNLLGGTLLLAIDNATGRGADWTALQMLHVARDQAWSRAEDLNHLGVESAAASDFIDGLDAVAAGCAAAVLFPVGVVD